MKATQHKPTEGYPKLVLIIAHRILKNLPAHIERADILQEGYLGYLDAQKRFNPAVGASFETFANIKIRGAIQDYLRSWDTLGRSARTAAKQYARAYAGIGQAAGRYDSS
jgi:RNA polymerase sigma factor for flagellar operon FliA